MNTHKGNPPDIHPMRWLSTERGAAGVLLLAHRLIELEKSLKKAVPGPLTRQISVTGFQDGILEVTTYNAAQTAKLRQFKTTICERMLRDGWNIKDLKLRVSAKPAPGSPVPKPAKQARPLQSNDLKHFESLSASLKPGRLADAVQALLKRHGQENKSKS